MTNTHNPDNPDLSDPSYQPFIWEHPDGSYSYEEYAIAEMSGTYFLTMTNIYGCQANFNVNIEIIQPIETMDQLTDMHICNDNTEPVNIGIPPQSDFTYFWLNTDVNSSYINVTESGYYTLIATYIDGCVYEKTVHITFESDNTFDLSSSNTFNTNYLNITSINTTTINGALF